RGRPRRVGSRCRIGEGARPDRVGGLRGSITCAVPDVAALLRAHTGTRTGVRRRRSARREPPLAALGPSQLRSELPATDPHGRARAVTVAGVAPRVAGHLAGVALTDPLADEEPGRLQPSEELLLAARARGRRVGHAPEHGAGGLLPAAPPSVLILRSGRP